jgi:hypothetical protein
MRLIFFSSYIMVVLKINKENVDNKIDELNKMIQDPLCTVFILYYMHGCGPCNATRPLWDLIPKHKSSLKNDKYIAIVDIDQELSNKVVLIDPPNGFPTMKVVRNAGKIIENYDGERTVKSFLKWIALNTKNNHMPTLKGGAKRRRTKRKTRNAKHGKTRKCHKTRRTLCKQKKQQTKK